MAQPDLTPKSQLSKIILPKEGDTGSVDTSLPFGIYVNETLWAPYQITIYKQGSADQVSYVYKKLGGDILDLEIRYKGEYSANPQFQCIVTPNFKNLFKSKK